jgi:hypothetical protein
MLFGVATGVFAGAVQQAVRGLLGGGPWDWAAMALSVLLWGLLWPPIMWLG